MWEQSKKKSSNQQPSFTTRNLPEGPRSLRAAPAYMCVVCSEETEREERNLSCGRLLASSFWKFVYPRFVVREACKFQTCTLTDKLLVSEANPLDKSQYRRVFLEFPRDRQAG